MVRHRGTVLVDAKDAKRPIGTPRLDRRSAIVNCQHVPPMHRHGDGRALA